MQAHIVHNKIITAAGKLVSPPTVFGFVFKNTGNTMVLVSNELTNSDPFVLEPGDCIDTRNPNTLDTAKYTVTFANQNSTCNGAGKAELTVSTFILVNR